MYQNPPAFAKPRSPRLPTATLESKMPAPVVRCSQTGGRLCQSEIFNLKCQVPVLVGGTGLEPVTAGV